MAQSNEFNKLIDNLVGLGASLLKDGLADRPKAAPKPESKSPAVDEFIDWALDEINSAKVAVQEATTAGEARWGSARMDALRDAIAFWNGHA